MRINQLHNLLNIKGRRRYLRRNLTKAEAILWKYLKKSQLEGRKFRRQHNVGKYISDFYCPVEKLAIELDGSEYFTNKNRVLKDSIRSEYLNSLGIKVKRFFNYGVIQYIESVL